MLTQMSVGMKNSLSVWIILQGCRHPEDQHHCGDEFGWCKETAAWGGGSDEAESDTDVEVMRSSTACGRKNRNQYTR